MRYIKCTILSVFALAALSQSEISLAQTPVAGWSKCYGSGTTDNAASIVATRDGGYIMAGSTNGSDQEVTTPNHGGFDCWVVKVDAGGNIEWSNTYGGSQDDNSSFIKQTPDGGYILAASTLSDDGDVSGSHANTGNNDVWIVKLDSAGKITWQRPLGNSLNNYLGSVALAHDGGYVVAASQLDDGGNSSVHGMADVWVVKLSAEGSVMWTKDFGGSDEDIAQHVIVDDHSRILVAASTQSNDGDITYNHGKTDEWLICLDSTGKMIWQKTYGGSNDDVPTRVIQTKDGGYAMCGYTYSSNGQVTGHHGDIDMWVVKTDASGNLSWQKDIGGSLFDEASSIMQSDDGSYSVIGSTTSLDGDITGLHGTDVDAVALKLSSTGSLDWLRCIGGSFEEQGWDLAPAGDNGYVYFSTTYSGDGDVTGNHGEFDMWAIALTYPTAGTPSVIMPQASAYPTLTSGDVTIKAPFDINSSAVAVYNATGQIQKVSFTQGTGTLHLGALPAGNYIVSVGNGTQVFKITKE